MRSILFLKRNSMLTMFFKGYIRACSYVAHNPNSNQDINFTILPSAFCHETIPHRRVHNHVCCVSVVRRASSWHFVDM